MNLRKFTFEDDEINKFWKIEWNETTYTITFGEVGSMGLSKRKKSEDVLNDVNSLIKSKIKSGYVEEEITFEDKFNYVLDIFKKETAKQSIFIIAEEAETQITQSKFGGQPYLPLNKKIPVHNDVPLMLFAQFNLEELPKGVLPIDKGILQFFVDASDPLAGCSDSWDDFEQNGYRVVYYETIEECYTTKQMNEMNKLEYEYSPLECEELKLTFNIRKDFMSTEEFDFEEKFLKIWSNVFSSDVITSFDEFEDIYDVDSSSLFDAYTDEIYDLEKHKLLGYARYGQGDYRNLDARELVLLFQTVSDDNVSWGGDGEAGFFIKLTDLKNKRFDKVVFNWSCG